MPSRESLQKLLERWRCGDQAAATAIYRRYEQRLLRLAEQKLGNYLRPRVEPDDIVLSVLETVLKRIGAGQYSVDPSGSLWNLLRVITHNKIRKQAEYHTQAKRDVHAEIDAEPCDLPPQVIPREPTPEQAAIVANELERIRSRLKPADFAIFQLEFQGYTFPQIAKELGCTRQTVRYKARRIEELLRKWANEDSDDKAVDLAG
jgi:RNA polymerase sigma factor (sigma-70 family)